MKRILFVCTGNTCRSPMAEIILKRKLKLAGIQDVRVSSAGISAEDGTKISKNSFKALKEMGYVPYGFKSKRLTKQMIDKADIVICMSTRHKQALNEFSNVYTVKEVAGIDDIIDPYGGDYSLYEKTSHQIEDLCNILISKI